MAPAAFAGEGEDALYRRLSGYRKIDMLGGVLCRAVKLVEEGGERRVAGPSVRGSNAVCPPSRARPFVVGIAGKHHAVDQERVPAGRKQFPQPHLSRVAAWPFRLKDEVLRYHPAGRQPPLGL